MNESEYPSRNVCKVLEKTPTNKQLKSKTKCNDENILPEIIALPNPCRKRGRPKKSIENGKTESDFVNLNQSNCPTMCPVPDQVCDINLTAVNNVSRFGWVKKAMRVLND